MGSRLSAPGPQQKRFAAYIEGLANAAGHADRHGPLKNYCTGLLLQGERKSVEPMAARLAPDNVRRMHQSLHHLVADAPWSDEEMLAQVRQQVLPFMQKHIPVVAWIVRRRRTAPSQLGLSYIMGIESGSMIALRALFTALPTFVFSFRRMRSTRVAPFGSGPRGHGSCTRHASAVTCDIPK